MLLQQRGQGAPVFTRGSGGLAHVAPILCQERGQIRALELSNDLCLALLERCIERVTHGTTLGLGQMPALHEPSRMPQDNLSDCVLQLADVSLPGAG